MQEDTDSRLRHIVAALTALLWALLASSRSSTGMSVAQRSPCWHLLPKLIVPSVIGTYCYVVGFIVAPFATADGLDLARHTAVAVDPSPASTSAAAGSGVARDGHLGGEEEAALRDRDAELMASGVLVHDLAAYRAMQAGVDLHVSCELDPN